MISLAESEGAEKPMLNIDGALIIYEGTSRIRWRPTPSWGTDAESPDRLTAGMIGHIWPNMDVAAHVRRQIDQGQKVVVMVDGRDPTVIVRKSLVHTVPAGAVEQQNDDDSLCRLTIPPFTWLSHADRARGEDFLSRARSGFSLRPRPHQPPIIENLLVGTRTPLRFVFEHTPLSLGEMRAVIRHLFTAAAGRTTGSRSAELPRTVHRDSRVTKAA